jgi:hypothetical protein
MTRLIVGIMAGCAITSLPWLARNHESLRFLNFVDLPGGIIAVLLAGGNIHNYSLTVLLVANVGFYTAITHLCLRPRRH